MTEKNGSCELLEADISEAWEILMPHQPYIQKGWQQKILLKVSSIDHKMAEKTLQVTTQLNRNGENTSLARNMGTNDRMLRYIRIKSHFFTDTFFVTGKSNSTRGYSCVQIFVSDNGFVKVYTMTSAKRTSGSIAGICERCRCISSFGSRSTLFE